jgi:hypothetical protein
MSRADNEYLGIMRETGPFAEDFKEGERYQKPPTPPQPETRGSNANTERPAGVEEFSDDYLRYDYDSGGKASMEDKTIIANGLRELSGVLMDWNIIQDIMNTEQSGLVKRYWPRSSVFETDIIMMKLRQATNLEGKNALMQLLVELKKRYAEDSIFKGNMAVEQLFKKIPG